MDDKKKVLYDALSSTYDIGTYEQFSKDIADSTKRRRLYDAASEEYDLGDYSNFENQLGFSVPSAPSAPSADKINAQMAGEEVKDDTASTKVEPVREQDVQAASQQEEQQEIRIPQGENWWDTAQNMMRSTMEANGLTLPEQTEVNVPEIAPEVEKNAFEKAYEEKKAQKKFLEEANRAQVENLSSDIDTMLEDALSRSMKEYERQESSRNKGVMGTILHAFEKTAFDNDGAIGYTYSQDKIYNGATPELRREITDLNAAKYALDSAHKIIDEADKGGSAGALFRGFGDSLFDVRTWDMGKGDTEEGIEVRRVLKKYDEGTPLTPSEQALLDAKAVELATNAYFGSYVSRRYKAGTVTAQSMPFMIEMMINPASTVGHSAQSILARYALKRFAKAGVKKLTAKAIGVGGRVIGDAVGASLMAATTGAGRVTADALNRMNGDILVDTDSSGKTVFAGHEDGESLGKAFAKAFAATAIENHSEMLGEYFTPILGLFGKGTRTAFNKIGLSNVMDFIDNVNGSDIAKLLADFQDATQWNGNFGEIAEEFFGNVENAIIVGDMTLDTAKNTGVFNKDINIDTALGVLPMGVFFSALKTAGYRTPKFGCGQAVSEATDALRQSYGAEAFDDIVGRLNDALDSGGHKGYVAELTQMIGEEQMPQRRKALLDYAKSQIAYQAAVKGDEKRMENRSPEQRQLDAAYENGYYLTSPQDMNDARNMYDYQRRMLKDVIGVEDIDVYDNRLYSDSTTPEQRKTILDYLNAKATLEGMVDHVRDDIDSRVASAHHEIDANINGNTGKVQVATLKADNRQVYILGGRVQMTPDGTMVDRSSSEKYITIRDAKTGEVSSVSPEQILRLDGASDPVDLKNSIQEQITSSVARQASDIIEGKCTFNGGETYILTTEDGNSFPVQIVANEQGVVDNGDGTVNVVLNNATSKGKPVISQMDKEQIQQMTDATNEARLAQYEQQKAARDKAITEQEMSSEASGYHINDEIPLMDDSGNAVTARVDSEKDENGLYRVVTDTPVHGKVVNWFSEEELNTLAGRTNAEDAQESQAQQAAAEDAGQSAQSRTEAAPANAAEQNAAEQTNPATETTTEQPAGANQSALSRIPVDKNGNPIYEQAEPATTLDAITEQVGDREKAKEIVEEQIADLEKELAETRKSQPEKGKTIQDKIRNENDHNAKIADLEKSVDYWKSVLAEYQKQIAQERMAAEESRMAEELARQEAEQRQSEETAQSNEAHTQTEENAQSSGGEVTLAESKRTDSVKPIGQGVFGHIFNQFKGKAKEAFEFLANRRGGDLLGVFHHSKVGDIDAVWGDLTGGVAHIIDKHVGEGKSFATIEEAAQEINDIINNGRIDFENGDKVVFRKGNKLVTVRKNYRRNGKKIADKNWVLTAYDESAVDNRVGAVSAVNQGQAAQTAANPSDSKSTQQSPQSQEVGGNSSAQGQDSESKRKSPEVERPRRTISEENRKAVESIGRSLGVKVVWDETLPDENGYYDPKTKELHIAMDADNPLETVMGHEATHRVKAISKEAYQTLLDAVKEIWGNSRFSHFMDRTRHLYNDVYHMNLSENDIAEEVVADFVGQCIHDRDMMQRLAERLSTTEEGTGILATIKKLIHELVEHFRRLGMSEGDRRWAELEDAIDEAYAKAAKVANDISISLGGAIEGENGTEVPARYSVRSHVEGVGFEAIEDDGHGNFAIRTPDGRVFSAEHPLTKEDLMEQKDTPFAYLIADGLAANTINEETADMMYDKYASMLNAYLKKGSKDNGGVEYLKHQWQYVAETVYKTVAANSDAQYSFSLDITRVCKKNEAVIKSICEMQRRLGYGITPGQIMRIYYQSHEDGYQVPCPVCYVFTRYIRNGKYATIMLNGQKKYLSLMEQMGDPAKLSAEQKQEWLDYWVEEANRQAALNESNKEQLNAANADITTIEKEINDLSTEVSGGKLSKEEIDERMKRAEELDARYRNALNVVSQGSLDSFINQFILEKKKIKGKETYAFRKDAWKSFFFPPEIALDLRETATAIRDYPAVQRYRKSRGAAAGKEIMFAANNDIGDVVLALGSNNAMEALVRPEKMSDAEWKALQQKEYGKLMGGVRNLYVQAANETDPAKREKLLKKARARFKGAVVYAEQQSLRGGQRMWSWSDNIEALAPDVFMNLMQMDILGGALQSYSKQLEGIDHVARLNGYVNGSLMGKGLGYREVTPEETEEIGGRLFMKGTDFRNGGDYTFTDSNGEKVTLKAPVFKDKNTGKLYTLIFDSVVGVEPFGAEENGKHKKGLFELNHELDKAGNIIVGMNDTHVRAALADPRIFFCIPWHASGANNHILAQMYDAIGVEFDRKMAQDYTNVQEEKHLRGKGAGEQSSSDITQHIIDFWEDHRKNRRNYGGRMLCGNDFKCGIEGGVKTTDDVNSLSPSQQHYRELHDAVLVGVNVPGRRGKVKIEDAAKTDPTYAQWLKEIQNDEFLGQAYRKIRERVNTGMMTQKDCSFIYPYEYWDETSTFEDADVNVARYVEYCRRLGFKPKFCGKLDGNEKNDYGNFIDDEGAFKLLIDRRMYGIDGQYQDLDKVDVSAFHPDLVDPERTKEKFPVTRVADDAGVIRIVDKVMDQEDARSGGALKVDYDMTLDDAVKAYEDGKKFSLRGKETSNYDDFFDNPNWGKQKDDFGYEAYPRGRVEPHLAEREVEIVKADTEHGFKGYAEAKSWARTHIARTYNNEETGGKGEIRISNTAIDKYLSQSAVDKSASKDVHLSVLKVLPDVIRESVDAEQHPDFKKGADGKRSAENGINPNVTIHRLYGAVTIDGKPYRVKVTLKEDRTTSEPKVPHSYEATKIELLAGTLGNSASSLSPSTNNSITATKLLHNVEKSYDKGKKLLDESEIADHKKYSLRERTILNAGVEQLRKAGINVSTDVEKMQEIFDINNRLLRMQIGYQGSAADYDEIDLSYVGTGEGAQAHGYGTYIAMDRETGVGYATRMAESYEREEAMSDYDMEELVERACEQLEEKYGFPSGSYDYMPDSYFEINREDAETFVRDLFENAGDSDLVEGYDLEELLSDDWEFDRFVEYLEKELCNEADRIISDQEEVFNRRNLYTIEFPDNNGKNYIEEDKIYTEKEFNELVDKLLSIPDRTEEEQVAIDALIDWAFSPREGRRIWDPLDGRSIYEKLSYTFYENEDVHNSDKAASELLRKAGIVGIHYNGNRDGECYVVFNPKDTKITDHVRFFRTKQGEVYGFTVGGKIYIDPRVANAETPIHEYAHLWSTALRSTNAEEWKNVVDLMKGTSVWDEVRKTYSELETDDEIADEVLATYSGRRGAERLREEQRKIAEGKGGVFEKAEAISALERVKEALSRFWKAVADFLHIKYTSAEEIADRVLKDLLDGVNPNKLGKGKLDGKIREQFVGEKGAANMDAAEEATTRLDNLAVAREMEEAKKDAKAIKMATGWERGADGKWRYETPDERMLSFVVADCMNDGQPTTLRDLLGSNSDIFNYYPQLAYVNVKFSIDDKSESISGSYSRADNQITLSTSGLHEELNYIRQTIKEDEERLKGATTEGVRNTLEGWLKEDRRRYHETAAEIADTLRPTLIHEVQHAIQHIEGFAKGGNERSALEYLGENKTEDVKIKKQLAYKISKEKGLGLTRTEVDELISHLEYEDIPDAEIQKQIDALCEKYGITEDQLEDIYPMGGSTYEAYRRFGGEVEARNAASRVNMSPEQRRRTLAATTEDVSREDQIILGEAYGVVEGEGKKYSLRRPFGGNSGYVGYSMSRRAANAREDGRFPKTDFKKEYGVSESHLQPLVDAGIIDNTEWHHTSSYGNKTTFYGWNNPEDAAVYAEHKKEIDAIVKEGKPKKNTIKENPYTFHGTSELSEGLRNAYNEIDNWYYDELDSVARKYRLMEDEADVNARRSAEINALKTERDSRKAQAEDEIATESDKAMLEENRKFLEVNDEIYDDHLKQAVSAREIAGRISAIFDTASRPTAEKQETGERKYSLRYGRNEEQTQELFSQMRNGAEELSPRVLTKEIWDNELAGKFFDTPLGKVKLGDNQYDKNIGKGRANEFGMLLPTIERPDLIFEEYDPMQGTERDTKYVYVKTFVDKSSGEKYLNYASVSVSKVGMEVVTSSHHLRDEQVLNKIEKEPLLWNRFEIDSEPLAKRGSMAQSNAPFVANVENNSDNATDSDEDIRIRYSVRHSSSSPSHGSAYYEYERATRITNSQGEKKDTANLGNRLYEAYVDKMASLKAFQDAVIHEKGGTIEDGENAYLEENAMSSKNKAQTDIFMKKYFEPIKDVIRKLINEGATYDDIIIYMVAKHGLERNEVFSEREGKVRDYSGLTALVTEETDGDLTLSEITARAKKIVNNFENKYLTLAVFDLWNAVNNATKESLKKTYLSGLLSKDAYESISQMFKYYIPLKGWADGVAADYYEYFSDNGMRIGPLVKKSKGRRSLADDPIATIAFDAQGAIVKGNRNLMKQKFLNFVLNHPTSLATVSKQWYVRDASTGEWVLANPTIPEGATLKEIAEIFSDFEKRMKEEEKLGNATTRRAGLKLAKPVMNYEANEHLVRVVRGGQTYNIYINGNPRAAQAVNGLTNPSVSQSWLAEQAQALKNFLARMFTSQNPSFIVSNLSRDLFWSETAVVVKEGSEYWREFNGNLGRILGKGEIASLIRRANNDALNMSNPTERYFNEFIRNGGETGFTQLLTVDNYKRDLRRFEKELRRSDIQQMPAKVWHGIWDSVEFLNRCGEDISRFTVYMTSRQMGRSVEKSISDAKEITVNFNRKGSGGYGAQLCNYLYIFFNASIQSVANFAKIAKEHPGRMAGALGTYMASGFLMPVYNAIMISLFGGDDDSYWDLPEWVRRNNIVIPVPFSDKGFITLPLPHELRPFYGLGEAAMSALCGREKVGDALVESIEGFSGMLPLDFTGNGGNFAINFTPTIGQPLAQWVANTDYFGTPIYKKGDYNQLRPEWTKAYKSTSPWLVNGTRLLNEISGGDDVVSGRIDFNPAIIEHLVESYFGGVGKTLGRTATTFSMIWNEDARNVRNVPIVNSFYRKVDERNNDNSLNRRYYDLLEEKDDIANKFSGYKQRIKEYESQGNTLKLNEYREKLAELVDSPEFIRYCKIKGYSNAVSNIKKNLRYVDIRTQEELEAKIRSLKVQLLEELENPTDTWEDTLKEESFVNE